MPPGFRTRPHALRKVTINDRYTSRESVVCRRRSITYWSYPRNHNRIQLKVPYRSTPRYGGEVITAPTDLTFFLSRTSSSLHESPVSTMLDGVSGIDPIRRSHLVRSCSCLKTSTGGCLSPFLATNCATYFGDMLNVFGMSTDRYAVDPFLRCFPCMIPRMQPFRNTSSAIRSSRDLRK